jgi:hypothetical protein
MGEGPFKALADVARQCLEVLGETVARATVQVLQGVVCARAILFRMSS